MTVAQSGHYICQGCVTICVVTVLQSGHYVKAVSIVTVEQHDRYVKLCVVTVEQHDRYVKAVCIVTVVQHKQTNKQ